MTVKELVAVQVSEPPQSPPEHPRPALGRISPKMAAKIISEAATWTDHHKANDNPDGAPPQLLYGEEIECPTCHSSWNAFYKLKSTSSTGAIIAHFWGIGRDVMMNDDFWVEGSFDEGEVLVHALDDWAAIPKCGHSPKQVAETFWDDDNFCGMEARHCRCKTVPLSYMMDHLEEGHGWSREKVAEWLMQSDFVRRRRR